MRVSLTHIQRIVLWPLTLIPIHVGSWSSICFLEGDLLKPISIRPCLDLSPNEVTLHWQLKILCVNAYDDKKHCLKFNDSEHVR